MLNDLWGLGFLVLLLVAGIALYAAVDPGARDEL